MQGRRQEVTSAWWKVRTALGFALRIVVGGNYVWCLAIVVKLLRFGQAGAKRCGGRFKVVNWSGNACQKSGGSFYREGGFSLCNTAVLKFYYKSNWVL